MQKFHKGDLVRVEKTLREGKPNFENDCDGIVAGVSADSSSSPRYTIFFKYRGEWSWYYDSELTLIEPNRSELRKEWEEELANEINKKSDLDWIFANGEEVISKPMRCSVEALAKCFGFENIWGEKFVDEIRYYYNSMATLEMAKPFLQSGDKEGWIKHCESVANK